MLVGPPRATRAPATWIREAHAVARAYGSGLNTHVAETADEAAAARAAPADDAPAADATANPTDDA